MKIRQMMAKFRLKKCTSYGIKPSDKLVKQAKAVKTVKLHKKSNPIQKVVAKPFIEKTLVEKFPDIDVLDVSDDESHDKFALQDLGGLKFKIIRLKP